MRDHDSHVYLHDANYNVTALVEDDATVVERYAYTPYGAVTVLDADFSADNDNKSDIENEYLYTGKVLWPEGSGRWAVFEHSQLAPSNQRLAPHAA